MAVFSSTNLFFERRVNLKMLPYIFCFFLCFLFLSFLFFLFFFVPFLLYVWCIISAYQELWMWEVPICKTQEEGPSKHSKNNRKHCYDPPTMRTLQQIHITDLPSCSISPLSISYNSLRELYMTSELSFPASRSTAHTRKRYGNTKRRLLPFILSTRLWPWKIFFSLVYKIKNNEYRVRCTVTDAENPPPPPSLSLFKDSIWYDITGKLISC
jgi:hypothetical protein